MSVENFERAEVHLGWWVTVGVRTVGHLSQPQILLSTSNVSEGRSHSQSSYSRSSFQSNIGNEAQRHVHKRSGRVGDALTHPP